MRKRTKLSRLKAYLKYGIEKAEQEHREHEDVLVLKQWVTTVDAPCGTVGCALGSYAMSARGKRDGWAIGVYYPAIPLLGRLCGAGALAHYLAVNHVKAKMLCGMDLRNFLPETREDERNRLTQMRKLCEQMIEELQ